jgi:PAS domain S-box-containing protein
MKTVIAPTQTEIFFTEDDIIVSKTDLKGRITYANQSFCQMAGYTEAEMLGQPHSIIRHPDMPRAVFKLLWDTVLEGREIFAYVKNMAKNGNFYWVFADVCSRQAACSSVRYDRSVVLAEISAVAFVTSRVTVMSALIVSCNPVIAPLKSSRICR